MKDEKSDKSKLVLKPGMKYGDHVLNTRRDFLSQGLITGSAFALLPSALDLMVSNALAQSGECVFSDDFTRLTPVIILDLSGGCNFPGSNVSVGGVGGQLDRRATDSKGVSADIDYKSLGLPTNIKPSTTTTDLSLGLAFHSGSPLLRGIKSTANASVTGKMEGMIYCTTSDNDTGNNQYNPAYWLLKAGAKGKLAGLGGTRNSASGGNSAAAGGVNPATAPVQLVSASDARGLTSLGKLGTGFSNANKSDKIDMILRSVSGMSDKKLESINRRNLPEALQQIVSCNIKLTPDQIKTFSPDALDPSRDVNVRAAFPEAYSATPNAQGMFVEGADGDQRRVSTLAYLVLKGYVGVGTIELGGYDYHAGATRPQADAKDEKAGQMIGRIMSLARSMGQSCFVIAYTDGGVAANGNPQGDEGRFEWGGDNGERSASLMFLYEHNSATGIRRPEMLPGQGDKIRQIGAIKKDGSNDNGILLTSNSTVNTAKAMVLNYLNYHGRVGDYLNVIGDNPMANNLEKYLGFAPKKT